LIFQTTVDGDENMIAGCSGCLEQDPVLHASPAERLHGCHIQRAEMKE
jgi:hypothetical protein